MVSLPLFVYGTLRDDDVLAAVLCHAVDDKHVKSATALGYQALCYPGRTYPALVASAGATAMGQLLGDLTATDLARLDAFEGAEYQRVRITVLVGTTPQLALAYLPTIDIADDSATWSLEYWRAHHKAAMMLDLTGAAGQDGLHRQMEL
ncbi:gamma-glutamylcyclotransferase family protein [Devosia epidermidihirudinis]|uniref:gamma-glutamylcyclotransferase family protein n=1 Tax=Devosia epidermidihirudinis TaxID=1293439 RepID=UPI00069788E1|nr:gamma-glutamylcyclotransferase family protein [Devosia epidermidihirudinis]